jgi:hypothetical protein
MEPNYNWKLKGLAKGVDPNEAVQELERIQKLFGYITPELLVTEASNPESILHPIFEWDNKKAAYNYRLQQARILLNNVRIDVIADGETQQIAVYEVTTFGEGYKSIHTFTPNDVEYIKMATKSQLDHLTKKLKRYKEFEHTIKLIQIASSSLDEVLFDINKKRKQPIDLSVKN